VIPRRITKNGLVTFLFGLGLLIPAYVGLFLSGVPTVTCPLPILTVIPGFICGPPAVILPTLLFFAWSPGLFRGDAKVPWRSYVLLAVLTALSGMWFVGGWKLGLQYQDARYTRLVCAVNCVWVASLWAMFIYNWRRAPSFRANLLLHWIMFAWLSWYAFPYLGELP
jgi:hypothetical protein